MKTDIRGILGYVMVVALIVMSMWTIRDMAIENQIEIRQIEIGTILDTKEESYHRSHLIGSVRTSRTEYKCNYSIKLENGKVIKHQDLDVCKNGINGSVIIKHSYQISNNSFKEYIVEFE